MTRWYAVHTHPRAEEAKALMHLRRHGFEAYLPRMARRRPPTGRAASVPPSPPPPTPAATPLFPRYQKFEIHGDY